MTLKAMTEFSPEEDRAHAGFVGLNLLFAVFSACYLWRKSANVFG